MPIRHKIILLLKLPQKAGGMSKRSIIEILLKGDRCKRKLINGCGHALSPTVFERLVSRDAPRFLPLPRVNEFGVLIRERHRFRAKAFGSPVQRGNGNALQQSLQSNLGRRDTESGLLRTARGGD